MVSRRAIFTFAVSLKLFAKNKTIDDCRAYEMIDELRLPAAIFH